ncbi:acyl-CoA dehydrogenase [Amphibiibacter pelophylacis]|uniref:Acyl-CoA dehydrogenase n=1 Tax=Amphibiibacter pelophylacis TaxID=1799477 RepID=A0ACC6P5A7_9BURK
MTAYRAPVADLIFNLRYTAGLPDMAAWPGLAEADIDTAQAVLEECARLNEDVLAPLNAIGDRQPATLSGGAVTSTPGFKEAFRQYAEGGWQGLSHPESVGGQALPKSIATGCIEINNSANLSFALCPLLTDGAIEALLTAGSPELQQRYIPRLISGEWTGTMNLTEPQAGSDLAQIRTRAEPQPDGTYRVFGTKIYITWGEHDLAANIVHLVLARLPGAPEGVKGISLFVVPKFLVSDDGALGERNDVWCVGLEHKLGIKASPTAVLQFGDHGGAVGHLVGEPNRGLQYMFIMMNAARFGVGVQGMALAERASQAAVAYARDRVQSRPVDGSSVQPVTIIHHPDVRRMLMTCRAHTQGARALALAAASHHDAAHHHPDAEQRTLNQAIYEFLVPLVKGYSTEMSQTVASLAVQVCGGMGFIEETGLAQYIRDAKILSIYEGTTAIQANDLVSRKTQRDGAALALWLGERMGETADALDGHASQSGAADALRLARDALTGAARFMVEQAGNPNAAYAGSVPYLLLAGQALSGWLLLRSALVAEAAGDADAQELSAKWITARFYADHILPQCTTLAHSVLVGHDSVLALAPEGF